MATANIEDRHLPIIRIREAAQAAGLSPSTLRQYEELGLILPYREESGQRLYSLDDVEWLQQLQAYFRRTHSGPNCLAQLLGLIPFEEICRTTGTTCTCRPAKKAGEATCWQGWGTTGERRRVCRDCPAYRRKHYALAFDDHFRISLKSPAGA